MGGRGASSGMSANGKRYGTEYRTVLWKSNIKFVVRNDNSAAAPRETMTKGRVYVTISPQNQPKTITYYDKDNKRHKQIDLDRPHKGVLPHTHHGYDHSENDSAKGFANLTAREKKMVERVNKIWAEHLTAIGNTKAGSNS